MKGVTSEVIAEVRSRASLHEVVSEHVVLKRTGADKYQGLCPFHNEKTASFSVNDDKGFFICFGCHEKGDVFSFVQKIKKIDFIDSVCELAHKYGVKLVETHQERQEYDKRSAILMLYQQASEYYVHMLNDEVGGQKAREYLNNRGIGSEIIEKFKLGYAPDLWDGLLNFLTTNAKAAPQTLAEAGLVGHKAETNRYYDIFKNRLMVPIFDGQGRVIAFGGRTLADDQVKYLNSPASPIYTKGQHLYAFHLAKEAIKEKDAVIVVEGYFDVITSHLYGFTNTVATCGTALTEQQAKSLVRYTDSKRVLLAFDADAAGVKAVDSGVETLNLIAEGVGLDLRVIQIPGGKDPDECLRASEDSGLAGPAGYAKAIAEALPLIDYQLQKAMAGANITTHTGRIDAAKKVVPILAQIKTDVARSQYIQQWSSKLVIDEIALSADVSRYRKENRAGAKNATNQQAQSPRTNSNAGSKSSLTASRNGLQSGYIDAERQLLALYLTSRDDYERVQAALLDETLLSPEHQTIKDAIDGIGSHFNNVEDLREKLSDRLAPDGDAVQAFVDVMIKVEIMRKQNSPIEVILREFRLKLLAERLKRALAGARAEFASVSENDQQALQSKIIQLKKLQDEILSNANTPEEIDALKRKIDVAIAQQQAVPAPEASVEPMPLPMPLPTASMTANTKTPTFEPAPLSVRPSAGADHAIPASNSAEILIVPQSGQLDTIQVDSDYVLEYLDAEDIEPENDPVTASTVETEGERASEPASEPASEQVNQVVFAQGERNENQPIEQNMLDEDEVAEGVPRKQDFYDDDDDDDDETAAENEPGTHDLFDDEDESENDPGEHNLLDVDADHTSAQQDAVSAVTIDQEVTATMNEIPVLETSV